MTNTTNYRNWYIVTEIYTNIIFMIKFLVAEKVFWEISDYGLGNNNKILNTKLFPKKLQY